MFTKDNRTETFLSQMGVEYRYTNRTTFRKLSPGWNEKNLARPVPVREEAVLEYAALMESGSAAPAPILHKTDSGLDVLDGVQRLAAAQMNRSTVVAAYIVRCDSEDVVTAIRVLANARLQGRPEPPEWTKRQAVDVLVITRGLSIEEVARMGGWKVADIARLKRVLEWGFKIRCIGGPTLPDTLVTTIADNTSLAELSRAPTPISAFCTSLKKAKFSNSESEPFVRQFFQPIHKSSKAHETFTERLEAFRKDPEVQIRLSGRRTTKQAEHALLRRTLKSAETVAARIADQGSDVPYVDEFFRLLNTIERHLREVATRHPKPQAADVPADMWRK